MLQTVISFIIAHAVTAQLYIRSPSPRSPCQQSEPHPCASDLSDICGMELPSSYEGVYNARICLRANHDFISNDCRSYVEVKSPSIVEPCFEQIVKFCRGVQPGSNRLHTCLYNNMEDLTVRCANALMDENTPKEVLEDDFLPTLQQMVDETNFFANLMDVFSSNIFGVFPSSTYIYFTGSSSASKSTSNTIIQVNNEVDSSTFFDDDDESNYFDYNDYDVSYYYNYYGGVQELYNEDAESESSAATSFNDERVAGADVVAPPRSSGVVTSYDVHANDGSDSLFSVVSDLFNMFGATPLDASISEALPSSPSSSFSEEEEEEEQDARASTETQMEKAVVQKDTRTESVGSVSSDVTGEAKSDAPAPAAPAVIGTAESSASGPAVGAGSSIPAMDLILRRPFVDVSSSVARKMKEIATKLFQ